MKTLKLKEGQKLWFTSDTHFSHANICSATTQWSDPSTSRKFDALEQMDDILVQNINDLVSENDILFHLGDWSFGGFENIKKFRERLVCKNIHIITGNHDHHIERNKEDIQSIFSSVNKYLEMNVRGGGIDANLVLMHFPIASWNNMSKGFIHLHGHVHLPKDVRIGKGKTMDVGVDGNDFKPISLDEVLKIMKAQPISSAVTGDHHILS
jgi:calcineurin-like phosphoesterase family protein